MQKYRDKKRKDINCRRGPRLAAAEADENQEHQQQQKREVEADRDAEDLQPANGAGSLRFCFLLSAVRGCVRHNLSALLILPKPVHARQMRSEANAL